MRYLIAIFLSILVFLGCGSDNLEKDTNLLASEELLASEDPYRFQALPILEDGSLIPLDEVPVVSVEPITEDPADGFFTWRLKANPVPRREDLVVLVRVVSASAGEVGDTKFFRTEPELIYGEAWATSYLGKGARLIVIRKNKNSSKEFKAIIPDGVGKWHNRINAAATDSIISTRVNDVPMYIYDIEPEENIFVPIHEGFAELDDDWFHERLVAPEHRKREYERFTEFVKNLTRHEDWDKWERSEGKGHQFAEVGDVIVYVPLSKMPKIQLNDGNFVLAAPSELVGREVYSPQQNKFSLQITIEPQTRIVDYISWVWQRDDELRHVRNDEIVEIEIGKRIFSVRTNDGYVIPPDFLFPYYVPDPELWKWEKSVP